ncbi:MAG: DNA polymerase III subunit delta [PVC group bacterium]|nr:DNA polymerase III subunit delta [PVC group bacterium]
MVKSFSYWDVKSDISSGRIEPLYLFAGEEIFLKRSIEEEIKKVLVPAESIHFNFNVFYAEEGNFNAVLDAVTTQPFMTSRRLVIVKNVEKFSAFEKDLLAFLSRPIQNSCLILETDKKLGDKFIKKIVKFVRPIIFSCLDESGLRKWVNNYTKIRGKKISLSAVTLLIENIGSDLDAVANALDKLLVYSRTAKQIDEKAVIELVSKTTTDSRFALLDALMYKRVDRALIIANELAGDGKHVTDIIGLINWQLKRVEAVKQLSEQGCPQSEMARQLKMSPYVVNIVQKQASRFKKEEIEKGFRYLLESDLMIKKGLKNPLWTLETLIVRLCKNV